MKNSIVPALKPLITVKEARQLLGSESKHLTDNQVQEVIHTLTTISRKYLENSSSNKALGSDNIEL